MHISLLIIVATIASAASFAEISYGKNVLAKRTSTTRLPTLNAATLAAEDQPIKKGGEATIASSTFNLAKSIIGCGVLSLPSGVAFFADEPSALIPAGIACALFGLVSGYTFSLIGKASKETESDTFLEIWSKSVSPKSSWIISSSITALCFLASLAYSLIIGDSLTSLAQTFNLPAIVSARNNVILLISTFILLPLCSMRSLNALSPFSLAGLSGSVYTAIFMAIRFLDKSYLAGGKFFNQMAAKPSFKQRGGYSLNYLTLVLLSMLSTSFVAHYNAPTFYKELKNASMPRFNKVVSGAFGFSVAFFIFVMSIGFLTFGGSSAGLVLNNYAGNDMLATFARFAIGVAMITGYPFTFTALREGLLDLGGLSGEKRNKAFMPFTVGLMGLLTGMALILKDVSFVVSLSGALFGQLLMIIIPTIMNVSLIKSAARKMGQAVTKKGKIEIYSNYFLMLVGAIMTVLGVFVSVAREMGKL